MCFGEKINKTNTIQNTPTLIQHKCFLLLMPCLVANITWGGVRVGCVRKVTHQLHIQSKLHVSVTQATCPRPHAQAPCPGPMPRPHAQAPCPGHMPRPHAQAPCPGHMPRPHAQATGSFKGCLTHSQQEAQVCGVLHS